MDAGTFWVVDLGAFATQIDEATADRLVTLWQYARIENNEKAAFVDLHGSAYNVRVSTIEGFFRSTPESRAHGRTHDAAIDAEAPPEWQTPE